MNFASDNRAGVAPEIAAALGDVANSSAAPYGADDLTAAVGRRFSELFERDVAVFFATTGTAANVMALSTLARPGGLVFCHEEAHINTDEGGAAEFLSDLKLVGLEGPAGKITPDVLSDAVKRFPPNPIRYGQPVAVSLSNLSESGTAYTAAEVADLARIAHDAGLGVHLDGSRFANALAGLDTTPADLTWKAGVDILSLGGTKNGCWLAEAVVFFDPDRAGDFEFVRKRAGHLISKQQFIAAQFARYLEDDLWLDLAGRANRAAKALEAGIVAIGGRAVWPVDGNEMFAVLPKAAAARAEAAGAAFYEWDAPSALAAGAPRNDETVVRLVTNFSTTADEVAAFLAALGG